MDAPAPDDGLATRALRSAECVRVPRRVCVYYSRAKKPRHERSEMESTHSHTQKRQRNELCAETTTTTTLMALL